MESKGSDTTSTTMSAAFHFLLHHPEALQRAQSEVRAAFASGDEIRTGKQLDSCKNLESCLKESLRLAPAVANFMPRRVGDGGAVIDGCIVPEGTIVGASLYALHRNPEHFPNPDVYRPERWMADQGRDPTGEFSKAMQKAFNPFSAGPRMCVGSKLAWMELAVTVAKTLFVYDMRLTDDCPCQRSFVQGQKCDFRLKSFATAFVDGPVVQVRRRLEPVHEHDLEGAELDKRWNTIPST
jgi:cytochrome P450